jgi:hypothetical protein
MEISPSPQRAAANLRLFFLVPARSLFLHKAIVAIFFVTIHVFPSLLSLAKYWELLYNVIE